MTDNIMALIEELRKSGLHEDLEFYKKAVEYLAQQAIELEAEEVYLNDYQTPREARIGLTNYFEFYNYHRPHQSLQYQTPAEVYITGENPVQLSQIEMEDSTLF